MATITSGLTLTMQNNRYGITSETTATAEVRATPAPTTTRITNSIENGSILVVYDGVFNPAQFDPTFQDNTAGITAITGYQEYLATDVNNDNGLRISGWASESFDSLFAPNFDTLYGGADSISASANNDMIRGFLGSDTLTGNDGDDTVIGGATETDNADSANTMFGGQGNDTLYGGGAADVLYGGIGQVDKTDGNDVIYGGLGADTIFGNAGNDLIYGDAATSSTNDTMPGELIYGGQGNDTIFGQEGNDILAGGGGLLNPDDPEDTVNGGEGNDTIVGNGGNDILNGDGGNDSIFGGKGNDQIDGGTGNDALMGQVGDDTLTGGDGNDIFFFTAGHGNDQITDFNNGGDGSTVDTLQFDTNLGVSTFAELQSASVVIEGNLIFSFGDGTTVLITGVTSFGQEDVAFTTPDTFFAEVFALGF